MRLLHPGPRKQLVISPYWTRNRARPIAVRSGQSVSDHRPGTWSSQECVSSSAGTREAKVAIMQLTTDAATWWSRAASSRLRPPPPENPKVPETRRIDAVLGGEHPQRHQVVGQHGPGERLAQRAGRLGQRVLVPAGDDVEPLVLGGPGALLPPQRVLGLQQRGQPRGRPGQVEPSAAPGEGVVHEDDVAPASQVVRRSATGVVRGRGARRPADSSGARGRPAAPRRPSARRRDSADRERRAGAAVRRPGAAARRWCPGRSRPTSAAAGSVRRRGARCPPRPRSAGRGAAAGRAPGPAPCSPRRRRRTARRDRTAAGQSS